MKAAWEGQQEAKETLELVRRLCMLFALVRLGVRPLSLDFPESLALTACKAARAPTQSGCKALFSFFGRYPVLGEHSDLATLQMAHVS